MSVAKTKVIIFSNKRSLPPVVLKIGENVLPVEEDFRYLGIVFDKRLTYKNHISKVEKKCAAFLNIMKLIAGTNWGALRGTPLQICRAIVRPLLEYGIEAYYFGPNTYTNKIQKIENAALRICCGGMKSTPACALQVACSEMPMTIKHEFLCLKYKVRVISTSNHPANRDLIKTSWEDEHPSKRTYCSFHQMSVNPVYALLKAEQRIHKEAHWTVTKPSIDLSLQNLNSTNPTIIAHAVLDYIRREYPLPTKLFTDGFETVKASGAGVVIPQMKVKISKTLPQYASSFSAEMYGIKLALKWIKENDSKENLILFDCLAQG